ncbi:DUF1433 domain-containing protein [Ligilactobacillus araffinosus]|uniref:Uncharacterized protein n=1 Tax=Ligilactobacillus araffinosus DSM 20653 TaxID=1423820 RepID=A0A0R1Z9Z8_9LACO|nr:DUF1433 domain-containing protein [Ligilactobacillus araffinosus]KRM51744.1 hypothetical protein FC64_GL000933 [Ligilactobacillus araffinosus DSM 20653]
MFKKVLKIIGIGLGVLLLTAFIAGAIQGFTGKATVSMNDKGYMIKVAKDHQKEMDQAVRYGDKDHHIKTITYQWNTVEHNPMGGFMLNGYVNGDKNLDFGMAVRSDDGGKHIYCYEYTCAEQLDDWTKDGN